jgi:L-lactate dehydrogenase complex protein LldF
MNMAGKLQARGAAIEVRHVAEVLAGMTDRPAHRRSENATKPEGLSAGCRCTSPRLQGERPRGARRRQPAEGAGKHGSRLHRQARQGRARPLPEFDALRDAARDIKNHTCASSTSTWSAYEAQGDRLAAARCTGRRDAEDARASCSTSAARRERAKTVTKGKSMIAEEIGLNDAWRRPASTPVETDLGEYIIQLRGEPRATSSRRRCT